MELGSHLSGVNILHNFVKQCESERQIPLTVTKFENCPQTLLDSVGTPLMYLMPSLILWSPLEQVSMRHFGAQSVHLLA